MEGKGTPKNEQNQFCHSPSVKAMTPSEVEGQDSHAAGVKCSLRDLSPSLMAKCTVMGGQQVCNQACRPCNDGGVTVTTQ